MYSNTLTIDLNCLREADRMLKDQSYQAVARGQHAARDTFLCCQQRHLKRKKKP